MGKRKVSSGSNNGRPWQGSGKGAGDCAITTEVPITVGDCTTGASVSSCNIYISSRRSI